MPWRYGPLFILVCSDNTSNEIVNDVTGAGGMTRSGHCYALGLMGVGQGKKNVKETNTKIAETQMQKEKTIVLLLVKTNAPVTKDEAVNF